MGNTPERKFGDLSLLDEGLLAELLQQRGNDLPFLDALNEELKKRNSDAANNLHIMVIMARRALVRALPSAEPRRATPTPSESVHGWLHAFLGARKLTRPDRRPLYRYRMVDSEYEQAKKILRRLVSAKRLLEPDSHAGALFVAYCAEWFRRESASTSLRWDDPAPDLFPSLPYTSKQALATTGLKYWKRPLRQSAYAREFLLTVVLEGGFPVRILAEGARGWLKDYLRTIMRRAIAQRIDRSEEILAITEEERGRMRKSYQHDDFIALCSELVTSLLKLRRQAETESAGGIRNSALLDTKQPGWRDELPIYVPAEDEALIAELLTGLLDEKMIGLTTDGVEVRRYLVNRDGEWWPALQLLADGEIPPAKLSGMPTTSRAHAIAAGELGNHLAGEVALFEPPVGEQRRWRVRPYTRAARLLINFPFTAPVTTTVSSPDCAPYSWTWPRGGALRSDVLVFKSDEDSTPHEPLLRFFRAGSVSSPVKTLHVLVPYNWDVELGAEDTMAEIEDIPALGCKLARLTAAAYFHSGEDGAIRFRVEPNSDEREYKLELNPFTPTGFTLADGKWELIASPVQPLIHEAGTQRPAGAGELFVRRPGGKWTPLSGPLSGAGLMELSWRDPVANIQIEKRQLALVPGDADIIGTMKNALVGEIHLRGLPGWTAAVHGPACTIDSADAFGLLVRFTGRPVYRLPMTLQPPGGQSFDVIVPLVGRDPVIALANGKILAPGEQVDIGTLRGAVAVSPRRTIFHLGAKGSRSGIKTVVDGEVPFGILRSAIDEILATLSNQDDLAEIVFIGDLRPPIRIRRYRHEPLIHDGTTVRWLPPSTHFAATPVARMVLDPQHEHALEYTADGMWRLTERCKGPCLVYLRDGVDVVSRPIPVLRPDAPNSYAGALVSALAMTDYEKRQRAIVDALARLGRGDGDTDDLKWLRDAATNLNGLPANALDGLKLLPSSAETLIHLLFSACDAGERSIIWALQNELPFLWLAQPIRAWWSVIEHQCTSLISALENVLGRERAMNEAVAWLRGVCRDLIALEPALETIFRMGMAGLSIGQETESPSLQDLTSGYIRDQYQRGSDAPNKLAACLTSAGLTLPLEIETKSHTDFAGLFAPVLLAASAREKLVLDRELALIARRTLREDPMYVSGAWLHLVKFYG